MAILKERTAIYEFSLIDVKKLIADNLNVDPHRVQVHYKLVSDNDDLPGYPTYHVAGLTVTVTE